MTTEINDTIQQMPLSPISEGTFLLTFEHLELLWNRFRKRIVGFTDFENPGADLQKQELDYKHRILNRYNDELGNEKLLEMVNDGKGQEALSLAAKIVTSNLVSFYSWRKSFGETDDPSIAIILHAFIDVASQPYAGPSTTQPIFDAIDKQNLKPSWDTLSTLLWAMRPRDYFPIKISYFQRLAEELSQALPKSIPSSEKFDEVLQFGKAFYQALQPLKPKDWVDVHSFIWCVCPTSYEKLEAIKNGRKKDSEKTKEHSKEEATMPSHPMNIILYGPPGTGKTYQTVNYALSIIENKAFSEIQHEEVSNGRRALVDRYNYYREKAQIEFITFHQNYAYEDFIQGLRPIPESSNGQLSFDYKDGVFKKISDEALKNYELFTGSSSGNDKKPPFQKVFDAYFKDYFEGKEDNVKVKMKQVSFTIDKISERTIYFTKQSGGTAHTLSIKTLSKLYEAGHYNIPSNSLKSYYTPLLKELLTLSKTISIDPENQNLKNYVIIIDEINRANISRVFGELITLIEEDKRFGQINAMESTLPSDDPFTVPPNLFIIGTMNTADKSIALIDIALRRRFEFEKLYPDENLVKADYVDMFVRLNDQINKKKGPDFQIGHAYFMENTHKNFNLKEIMNKKVIPLLYEYFMNDGEAVNNILTAAGIKTKQISGLYEFESF